MRVFSADSNDAGPSLDSVSLPLQPPPNKTVFDSVWSDNPATSVTPYAPLENYAQMPAAVEPTNANKKILEDSVHRWQQHQVGTSTGQDQALDLTPLTPTLGLGVTPPTTNSLGSTSTTSEALRYSAMETSWNDVSGHLQENPTFQSPTLDGGTVTTDAPCSAHPIVNSNNNSDIVVNLNYQAETLPRPVHQSVPEVSNS